MGRPPCCDKVGIKKGPWTPEEDIILVSYIQEHGPGNWRSVPANTGLLRCSKSCRLRWTNYLRPGIKRGNFTPHEEGMIIHLQALLGNKWAAIASYLPQRTDNDIKNYWNTHLKKKLKKLGSSVDSNNASDSTNTHFLSKSFNDRKSIDVNNYAQNFNTVMSQTTTYASSTENISRLLEGWMRSSPQMNTTILKEPQENRPGNKYVENSGPASSVPCYKPKAEQQGGDIMSNEEFDSILSFENSNNVAWENKSTCESNAKGSQAAANAEKVSTMPEKKQVSDNQQPPLSFLEDWLLNETASHVEDMMELSPVF